MPKNKMKKHIHIHAHTHCLKSNFLFFIWIIKGFKRKLINLTNFVG